MSLSKYIEELKNDCFVDEINLKESALLLPAKKAKWVSRLILEKNNLNSLDKERNTALNSVMELLKREAVVTLPKNTLRGTAETHEMIIDIDNKIENSRNLIEFYEKVEKVISSMSFDIGNIIKIVQLETT